MNYSEQSKFKALLRSALIFVLITIMLVALRSFLAIPIRNYINKLNDLQTLDSQVTLLQAEINSLEEQIEATGKQFGSISESKNVYIQTLDSLIHDNSLNIHKWSVHDIENEANQIYSITVELEVQGELKNIKDLVGDIYDCAVLYRINSISYRLKNSAFPWLWREIDDVTLNPWLTPEKVVGYSTTSEDDDIDEDLEVLDAYTLMQHSDALCYMEIQLLGTGG